MTKIDVQRIVTVVVVGIASFGAGVVVALIVMLAMDSPTERQNELETEVGRLRKRVAELNAELSESSRVRAQLEADNEEVRSKIGETVTMLEDMEKRIRERPTNDPGLGVTYEQISDSLPHFSFSEETTNGGTPFYNGTSSSEVRIILKGTATDLTAIQVYGSLTEKEITEPTSFALGILLNELTPSWQPAERLNWFARAAVTSEHQLNLFEVSEGIRVCVLPLQLDGVQAHIISFSRD